MQVDVVTQSVTGIVLLVDEVTVKIYPKDDCNTGRSIGRFAPAAHRARKHSRKHVLLT